MTTRRGFLGALAAACAANSRLGAAKPPTVLGAHAEILKPGNWLKVAAAANQPAVLQQGGRWLSGASNKAGWDPARRIAHYCGKRQSRYPIQHAIYREATHDWIKQWDDLLAPLGTFGHGYDYNIIDPSTGRVYFKNHDVARKIYYADPPDYVWSTTSVLPDWPASGGGNTPAMPCVFWSGPMRQVGNQGALILLVTADNPFPQSLHWTIYDNQAGAWQHNIPIAGGSLSTYERWGDYNAVHNCAVCFASDGETSYDRPYRLNADRTFTRLPNSPRGIGYLRGNVVTDPVTGNFLVMATDGTFWELDPTGGGTWGQLADAPSELWPLSRIGTICWAIPAYGVTVWATHIGEMWLYRHRQR